MDAGKLLGCRREIEHLRRSTPAKRQLDYTGSFPKWKKIKHQMVEHQPGLVPLRKEIRGDRADVHGVPDFYPNREQRRLKRRLNWLKNGHSDGSTSDSSDSAMSSGF